MTGTQIFSFAMVAYGVTGLYIAGNKRELGWWIGLSAQVLWVAFAWMTGLWAFAFSALVYGLVNARNLTRWRAERRLQRQIDAYEEEYARGSLRGHGDRPASQTGR